MREHCGQYVQRLGKAFVQSWYNLPRPHSQTAGLLKLDRFITIKPSALYPETAINTQLIFKNLPLLKAYLYTLYTGPTNTNNLNKRIMS